MTSSWYVFWHNSSDTFHLLQVVIADILIKEGQATEEEFQDAFGKDHVMFVSGDLTKQDETEGNDARWVY